MLSPADEELVHRDSTLPGLRYALDADRVLRLALSDVYGISEAEAARIADGQPYASLLDFWERARPSRPLAQRLAQVGALDAFGANRRDAKGTGACAVRSGLCAEG